MKASDVKKELKKLANPEIAEHSKHFFKTAPGQYGEGDQFHGIRVPRQRKAACKYKTLALSEVQILLQSNYHEERLTALFILIHLFQKGDNATRTRIYKFYLANTTYINNWDLVDSSAYKILGRYLEDKNRKILYRLAQSDDWWERRIAIISTLHFIRNNDFKDTLAIAKQLLGDKHELIHKAAGWMLREVGKRDQYCEEQFLAKHCPKMPRVMLRYAIEKFPEQKRKKYLEK